MRTLSILVLGVVALALAGCEKTIHEASGTPVRVVVAQAFLPVSGGTPHDVFRLR